MVPATVVGASIEVLKETEESEVSEPEESSRDMTGRDCWEGAGTWSCVGVCDPCAEDWLLDEEAFNGIELVGGKVGDITSDIAGSVSG